jgi:hypothetical protein
MPDSEKILDACVHASGGVRVSSIAGRAPKFESADYRFDSENVVAELKSFQKDFLSDPVKKEKMHLLFDDWVRAGKVVPQYGIADIRTDP